MPQAPPKKPMKTNSGLEGIELRRLTPSDSISELTRLLHRAYANLAAMGLRYMATHQSEEVTQRRVDEGECYVATFAGALVATIIFKSVEQTRGSLWLDRSDVASLGQFAVAPELRSKGLGARMMDLVESRGVEAGATELALDTAEPADHLVAWYRRREYRFIEYAQWKHTNYRSVIMSKAI
ncbi:ribosomal protein S18 acetylase RimI-like enzyme [Paraburkholderia sp. GAS33]